MQRESSVPRPDWREDCDAVGFSFHSMDGVYWDETACYRLSAEQVDELEAATEELHGMCLQAAEHIVKERRFEDLRLAPAFADYLANSWAKREPSLFGRFDFAYDGKGPPKLLEYNADTPTALLEASVVQWRWLQAVHPDADQFNSLHEKLIEHWAEMRSDWPVDALLTFASVRENEEDFGNIEYLRDTAAQAGFQTQRLAVEDIGWADGPRRFVDLANRPIDVLVKLYPWEWMFADTFGVNLPESALRVVEPPWKALLSNKALLVVLWELFPEHANLLPAYFSPGRIRGDYVEKPIYSREGANVTIRQGGRVLREPGSYGAEGFVYQAYTPIPRYGDSYMTVGSWIVGDRAAGIGIREDASEITCNTSRFLPHYFR
ncbi:Putative acid--amine ligase YgiC [Burkholderiales bacterium]|nr:MAG: glutathionylspermidine synthase family protein [Burkholderiales bacterium]CAG0996031.1 Putative acid--amine ligase YgiC [Burkholderiales bacterium]